MYVEVIVVLSGLMVFAFVKWHQENLSRKAVIERLENFKRNVVYPINEKHIRMFGKFNNPDGYVTLNYSEGMPIPKACDFYLIFNQESYRSSTGQVLKGAEKWDDKIRFFPNSTAMNKGEFVKYMNEQKGLEPKDHDYKRSVEKAFNDGKFNRVALTQNGIITPMQDQDIVI